MGAGGVPNRAVENIYGKRGDLPTKGAKPNSRYDLYFEGIGGLTPMVVLSEIGIMIIKTLIIIIFSRTTIIGCGKTECRIEFPIS